MKSNSLFANREFLLSLIVAALVVAVGIRAPVFLTGESLVNVLTDTSFLFMLTLAQMAIIITRGIDLSVAANLALTGMIVALFSRANPDVPLYVIIIMSIMIGAVLGAVNGAFVAFVGIPPIVVTLGTLAIFRGLIFLLAGGEWLTSKDMNKDFLDFPHAVLLGIPSLIWVALVVTTLYWLLYRQTQFGRGLYAIGGNPVAARYCGINIPFEQFIAYTLAGAVSGLCGYLWVARYGIAFVDNAQGFELTIIAACVIGGVSIAGGIGSVSGALLGALFLGVIVNALPVINVSPFWQMLISGAVILAAVIVNARSERPIGKLILASARKKVAAS